MQRVLQMIISERQIIQLISIAQNHANSLSLSESRTDKIQSQIISVLLSKIHNQQSEQLKEIE